MQLEQRPQLLFGCLLYRADLSPTGVVHEHVDATKALERLLHRPLSLARVSDVERDRVRPVTEGEISQPGGVSSRRNDPVTMAYRSLSKGASEAAGRSSDEPDSARTHDLDHANPIRSSPVRRPCTRLADAYASRMPIPRFLKNRVAKEQAVLVGDPRVEGWESVGTFEDQQTAVAWRDQLRSMGVDASCVADHPLDRFGRGDIYLMVPPGQWSRASEIVDNLE
jgi:hypothetical protein